MKNLLISVGAGYHPGVRSIHAVASEVSDSEILIINTSESHRCIDDNLMVTSSVKSSDLVNTYQLLQTFLTEKNYQLIGISFMSHHWDIFRQISNVIRRCLPECKLVAGGVHAWHIATKETLDYADYVCVGEGEFIYRQLLQRLSSGNVNEPLGIPGLAELHDGILVIPESADKKIDLNELPMPSLGHKSIYYLQSTDDQPSLVNQDPIINSSSAFIHIGRGCPFKCTFCINSMIEKPYLSVKKVDKVMQEIQAWKDRCSNLVNIFFMDEIFPSKLEWIQHFSAEYKKHFDLPFQITVFPGILNEQKLKLLKNAGLKEVSIGVQTGSSKINRNIYNRPDNNQKIIEEKQILSSNGIMAYYDFIINNPFESEEDIKQSLELIRQFSRPFYLKFYSMAFFPNHPITEDALRQKVIKPEDSSATISYLDVTTPHKQEVASHIDTEKWLLLWNEKLLKKVRNGSIESAYYLMMSYYGYSFIPRFVAEFIWFQFIKKRYWVLTIFTILINTILRLRNTFLLRNFMMIKDKIKQHGIIWTVTKIKNKSLSRN